MSYSDYSNYQSSGYDSGAVTSGGYSSSYGQGTYDAQYPNTDQYPPTDKDQPQYSQYDYSSYSSSYQQQSAETPTSADYYSSSTTDYGANSTSYSQPAYGQQSSSSGFDASSGYQASTSYQYSNTAGDQDSAMPVSNHDYSSSTSALGGYDYPTEPATTYTDPSTDQYEQTSSNYNYSNSQGNASTAAYPSQSYDNQSSFSHQPNQTSSSYTSPQQYSKPSNDYSQPSEFSGYHSSNDGGHSSGYQNPTQSRFSSSYQANSHRSAGSDGASFQTSQHSSTGGGFRQNNSTGSGSAGGYRSSLSFNASSSNYDEGGFGGYSGPAPGYNQNRKSDGWDSSSTAAGGGSGGGGGSSYYKNTEESFGGFSYNPKRDHGGSGFSQQGGNNNSSSSSFSAVDNDYPSRQGSGGFSQQGGRGSRYNSGSNTFNQRGGSGGFGGAGAVGFGSNNRGAPITARNMGSQSRMNYNQSSNDMPRPMSGGVGGAANWRGPRGGGPQNRGGFNNTRNDMMNNRSSPRGGGKFNNFGGPRDNNKGFNDRGGGNQFHPRNQNSFNNDRDMGKSKPLIGQLAVGIVKKNNEGANKATERTPQNDSAFHTNITKKAMAGKDENNKSSTKAPFYPNQKLLNEVESKTNVDKTKQPTATPANTSPSKIKEMTQDVRKGLEKKEEKSAPTSAPAATLAPTPATGNNKLAEKTVPILAPPKKVPETAEEIAREEEIQRKILASIVVLDPEAEKKLLLSESDKKATEVEMPEELRNLLQTLTTDHNCKLCNVRLASPQMPAHYNGKNHLKKVRIFAQTNGRSAGFNTESQKTDDPDKSKTGDDEKKEEEEEEVDEKKFCKVCKVSFLQEGQSEIHYKGKNHAKKLRQANRADIYECKICSVIVSSQEVLTAHLNGAPHKLQIRKMEGDNAHRGGLHGRGGYRGGRGGRGGGPDGDVGFRGRGMSRGRGRGAMGGGGGGFYRDGKLRLNEEDEELYNLLGLTPEKRYKFDLANFRTPSGKFYCSPCDVVMEEEPHFLLHLGSKKHRDKAYSKTKTDKTKTSFAKKDKMCSSITKKIERDMIPLNRNQ